MNENDGEVTVPSVTESTSVEGTADEIPSGNSGGEGEGHVEEGASLEGDGGEIMVEVVGSDVFVDGVGGGLGLEREKGACGDLGKGSLEGEGRTGDREAGESDDLNSEEVGDLSSQVWDALTENGVGNVEQSELMVNEEGLDVGKDLSREEGDVVLDGEAKNSGTEIRVGAATVNVGSLSGENLVAVEEVSVSESVGVIERRLAEEGVEQGTDSGHGEAKAQDYLTSGQDAVLDDEVWSPAIETGVLCSSEMAESLTTQTQLVSEEVVVVTKEDVLLSKCEFRDSVVVDENLAFPGVDQSSTVELVCQATDEGAINANAENLDPGAEVVAGEIDMMNKEEGLDSKHEVTETDEVDGNLHSSVEHQMLNVKTAGESSENRKIPRVSSPDAMEPFAGTGVARVDDSNCSDPIVEAPDNVSLSVVGGDVGEVNSACANKGSLDADCEVAAVSSVAVDVQVSSDAADGLAIENREAGCSVANIDDVEDQEVKDEAVGESSNIDVALCTVPKSSVDQTQYAIANEATAIDSEVPNSIVEVPTISNMDSFVVSSKEFENVECEKETSGNADKHGVVLAPPESTFEEACVDGGEDAGMDIDEVMDWKDDVTGNNALGVTSSNSEEDEHLKVVGSSEIEVAQGDLESSDEPNQMGDGGDVAFMELDENTKFEVQEGTDDNDVDNEPMELDSLKGDLSLSEVGENAKALAQLDGTGNTSTVQADLVISVENVLVAKEEVAVMDDKNAFNCKREVMHGDMGLQKDEKVNSPVDRSGNESIMQEKATSSGEQATTEIRDPSESGCQGNILVSSSGTREGRDTPSGKDDDVKVETLGGISVECGVVCKDPTQDAEVGDHDTSILVTDSTPVEENRVMQDEKQETVVQRAGTCIHEVYHGQNTDSPITDEILNKEASFVVHPDTVAGDDGESQPALTAASVPSVGNTAPSCIDGLAAPLPDGIGSVEVHVISKDATSLGTEASETHLFDATSNDIVKQATEAKDESTEGDDNPSMQAHSLEVQCMGFSDSKPIMDNLALDMDACPDEEGKWKSQGAANNENISLPHEAKCIKDDGDNMENSVQLQVLECVDGAEAGDLTGTASIAEQEVEVEEGYTDGEQVDFDGEQEPGTLQQTTEAENLTGIDEKIPEICNPVSSMTARQSFYLQPPENEGLFSVYDLVWGKVRSHPWWPGQIFDPADASEKATKYHKKDSFLVAYFGDRTFAWNDATVLKPFRMHFSQIEKHNNSEAFRHAVSCALEEVSRRVELGLACSCIPQDAYDKIKFQVVENTGIKQESSRRYGVDKSAGVSSFEPDKLLDCVKALAQSPYDETDQLELVIAKAQLSSFNRYKGYPELPEFQFSGELLESDADTSELNEAIEYPASAYKDGEQGLVDKGQLKGDNSASHKRKHSSKDTAYPSKKEKNLSDLMVDTPCSTDAEDGPDGKGTSKMVTAAGKKRKALDSVPDGSDKSKIFYAAKVSTAASPTPKPSFKIGECIRRAASQLTGSPSILKGSNEKFLKVDGDDDQPTGFEVAVQIPGASPRGRMSVSTDHSSLDEMLSQLHLAAQDPMKGYSFLNTIIPFFSSYRTSVVSKSRRHNSSTGRPGGPRKRKAFTEASNTPEEFEFDDVNDSYWTDRIIQNSSEEQLLQDGQNGGVEYQIVALEPKKPVKSGRKSNSRKRFSSSTREIQAEEPAEHVDRRKQDLPTELALNFAVGVSVPSEMNLNKTFRRFGPLMESETEVDSQASRARVVFKRCSDAEVAYSSAGKFNIFGSKLVNYELNYSPLVSYKPLPLPTLQGPEDAT